MTSIFAIIFFVFGIVIGSFLNVVIFRYNVQRSFGGRSGCMTCQNKLHWYELIPLFSFIAIKGRCLNCKTKISVQYPLVELITGIIFMGLFLKFQDIFYMNTLVFAVTMAFYATMFSLLIVIAVYDLRHKIIPDTLVLVLGILAFLGMFLFSSFGFNPHIPSVLEFLTGIIVALPFAIIWLVSKGTWMGLGDAKLMLGLGWLLGLSRVLSGMVVAFWSGAIIGLFLLVFSKKHGMKSEIPFAPFLVLGAIIAFLFELHLFPVGF
ncbi:MAG: prepilin peptidase [Candidatus Paceibacterota bacterium]|jgi:leader peptidase (prepilin peptidase)/N-methyltransferase